jgi:sensor histidine kinase YesM
VGEKRRKIWIDRFQTYISIRIALYFILYQVSVGLTFFIGQIILAQYVTVLGPEASTLCVALAVMVLTAVGGLFIYDAIGYTHRIVGPIYRFRKAIQAVIAGEEVDPMNLRKDDYLQELKDEFNQMLKVLEERGAVHVKEPRAKECATSSK